MRKKLMLLVNPNAGKGGYRTALPAILQVFCANNILPTVYMTAVRGDATRFVREEGTDYDILCCVGGDGTLSEVCNGLACLEKAPPLGYIPMGTANDVATTLALPRSPEQAAKRILDAHTIDFDIGKFGAGRFFTYIAAFGAFTEVSYQTSQEAKRSLGQLAYVLEGINSLHKLAYRHCKVEFEGGAVEDDFVFGGATNSTSVAGMLRLDPDFVHLGDGLFEVILVKNPRDIAEAAVVAGEILTKNIHSRYVTAVHSPWVRFTFDEDTAWTLDGESGGLHRTVELQNPHTPIRIFV